MRFFVNNFQIFFQIFDISLLLSNIVPKVCLSIISHRKSAQLAWGIVKSGNLILMQFYHGDDFFASEPGGDLR